MANRIMTNAELQCAKIGPCFYGRGNPVLEHHDVQYICTRTPASKGEGMAVCMMHSHAGEPRTGEPCCVWIDYLITANHVLGETMSKKRGRKKYTCAFKTCAKPPEFMCKKRGGKNYCTEHVHTFEFGCCEFLTKGYRESLSPLAGHRGSFASSIKRTELSIDQDESLDYSPSYQCERKGCKEINSPWWCSKKSRWYCNEHAHDKKCCESYGEEDSQEEDVKEVKFATID